MHPAENGNHPKPIRRGLSGMLGFTIIWFGQLLSLLGTAMTGFALAIWAWQITGQATALALVAFFSFVPVVLASPIAGALVDRHDRKKVMMLADLAAGLPTVTVLLLYSAGSLQIWHLYITGLVAATFQAFHFPAYSAAVTMMVRREQLGRANGMLSAAQFASGIFAPVVAALLMSVVGIVGVMLIDVVTFSSAVTMLLFVHIPRPPASEAGRRGMESLWKESLYGFRYIFERLSLLGLQLVFLVMNLIMTFGNTLMAPMILARTGDDKIVLGAVMSAASAGGLVGSVLLTLWGGPKRKVHGILMGMAFLSVFSLMLVGMGREVYVWAPAAFIGLIILPTVQGSSQGIWQAKVAPDVQGRVFSARLLIAQISAPLSMLITGPLADYVFEPAMKEGGNLADMFGWLVGTGPGAGMALILVITGVLGFAVALGGYAFRVVRNAETLLPDYDAETPQQPQESD